MKKKFLALAVLAFLAVVTAPEPAAAVQCNAQCWRNAVAACDRDNGWCNLMADAPDMGQPNHYECEIGLAACEERAELMCCWVPF